MSCWTINLIITWKYITLNLWLCDLTDKAPDCWFELEVQSRTHNLLYIRILERKKMIQSSSVCRYIFTIICLYWKYWCATPNENVYHYAAELNCLQWRSWLAHGTYMTVFIVVQRSVRSLEKCRGREFEPRLEKHCIVIDVGQHLHFLISCLMISARKLITQPILKCVIRFIFFIN